MPKNCVWFAEVNRKDLGLVGGKGGNLGEMIQAGLPIPDGFIVTSEAYYSFLEESGIKAQMVEALKDLNSNDSNRLKEVSNIIKKLIADSAMPAAIQADIVTCYAKVCGTDPETFVAVRSSATAEDLPGASFAGQQATFLNVHGAAGVVGAVQRCWASLFEARAIFYRADKGFDHMKVGIAVPVQRMVQSVKSGIMFTVDPITNDRTKLVIEAGFGLGEAVVSGSITPDRYIIDKATLTIVDKEINEQDFKIIRRPGIIQAAPQPVAAPVAPVFVAPPAPVAAFSAAPVTAVSPAGTGVDPAKFVISEEELKADLEAIKSNMSAPSAVPAPNANQTLTFSGVRNLTFSFSGDANSPAATAVPTFQPLINDFGVEDQYNVKVTLGAGERSAQKLTDEEILNLAKVGIAIENHYQYPQDTEWGMENGQVYIVQARPITTLEDNASLSKIHADVAAEVAAAPGKSPTVILKGGGASVGSASGPVKIIHSPSEIDQILKGDILVTEMTTPDYVPAMKRAAAIITDTGGRTCHAAIVSRELGIPCVVGTKTATTSLKIGQIVTVNGTHGLVYEGAIVTAQKAAEQVITEVHNTVSAPITATKVYVNLAEKELAAKIAAREVDGVGLLRAEFMIADIGEHPKKMIKEGRQEEFISKLADGLRMFAEPFHPRPVIYRATDFKTNEYRNLKGGEDYEMHEDNPMIGFRGCFRYISDPEVFNLELEAIKRVRQEFDNLHVMIPFVRTIDEMKDVIALMEKAGLRRTKNFKLYMMVEVPSTVFLIDKFCDLGIDGVSIGSNDLTQLILGVDRDSELCASEFDERNEAVMMALERLIKVCNEKGVVASICGQAPSVYPEITEKLVEWGINSVSVSPDMIDTTRHVIASVERKMILKKLTLVNREEEEALSYLRK